MDPRLSAAQDNAWQAGKSCAVYPSDMRAEKVARALPVPAEAPVAALAPPIGNKPETPTGQITGVSPWRDTRRLGQDSRSGEARTGALSQGPSPVTPETRMG